MRVRAFLGFVAVASVLVTACGEELEPTTIADPDIFFEVYPSGQPIGDTLDLTVFSEVDVQLRLERDGVELLGATAQWQSLDPDFLTVQPAQVVSGPDSLASLMRARLSALVWSQGQAVPLAITISHPGMTDVIGFQDVVISDLPQTAVWPDTVTVADTFELVIPVAGSGVGQTDTVVAEWRVSPSDRATILRNEYDSLAQELFAEVVALKRGDIEFIAEVRQPGSLDAVGLLDTITVEETWKTIEAGSLHTCAIASDDQMYCWGIHGSPAVVGPGWIPLPAGLTPITLTVPSTRDQIDGSGTSSCATTSGGPMYCWGDNTTAKLGFGDDNERSFPAPVDAAPASVDFAIGTDHACGLTAAGPTFPSFAYCFGRDEDGRLGDGPPSTTDMCNGVPCRLDYSLVSDGIGPISGYESITAGDGFTCALSTNGGVACWGVNTQGETGQPGALPTIYSTGVAGGALGAETVRAIDAGGSQACAVTDGGAVHCWGAQPGSTPSHIPSLVIDAAFGALDVSVGSDHACAVNDVGDVRCWGENDSGQLGDGTTTAAYTPGSVSGGLAFASVSAGVERTCAVTFDGYAYCWGENDLFGLRLVGNAGITDADVLMPTRVDDPPPR